MDNIISQAEDERLLTRGEVAALFRVHPNTVLAWVRRGCLTTRRTPGGHLRFKASDVLALLAGEAGAEGARA